MGSLESLDLGEDGEGSLREAKSKAQATEKTPKSPVKNVKMDTENVTVIPSMTLNPGEQQIILGDGGALDSHRSSTGKASHNNSKSVTPRTLIERADTSSLPDDLNVNHYSKQTISIIDETDAPEPKMKKRKKRKIVEKLQESFEEKPVLLVTRKKSTIKNVPLNNNVYPYDIVKKQKQHVKTLVNYQNRKKWQTLIEKDLINPNKKRGIELQV